MARSQSASGSAVVILQSVKSMGWTVTVGRRCRAVCRPGRDSARTTRPTFPEWSPAPVVPAPASRRSGLRPRRRMALARDGDRGSHEKRVHRLRLCKKRRRITKVETSSQCLARVAEPLGLRALERLAIFEVSQHRNQLGV